MNCPSCGKEIFTAHCPYCRTNAEQYNRILSLSNAHYNRGLALARANNLTDAAGHLERSVSIFKRNTQARNLLGLIYCAVGRVGEALKHWVVSVTLQPEDNLADGYLARFQHNQRKFEAMSDAVRMYNQALTYIKQKSEDMTIIQLKKVTELSPDFVDAHCLLALCYMLTNDKTRAAQCVDRALSRDAGNPIAWHYFRLLNPGRSATPQRTPLPEVKAEKAAGYPMYVKQNKSGLPLSGIICFILGALSMFAVVYVLYLPQQIAEREAKITSLNKQITELEDSFSGEKAAKDAQLETLTGDSAVLQTEVDALSQETAMQARILKVYAALPLLVLEEEPRLEEALASLDTVVTAGLPADVIAVYEYIQHTAKTELEQKYHTLGVESYNAGAFEEAKAQLLLAARYVTADSVLVPDTYYYLARMAEDDGDIKLAVSYYEVIVTHVDSARAAYAQGRLDALVDTE